MNSTPEYLIRELKEQDINETFFKTLENLYHGNLNPDIKKAKETLGKIRLNKDHLIFVAITKDNQVIGLTTLLKEPKFSHNFSKLGHIGDVTIRKDFERMGIGKALIKKAIESGSKDCYKLVLYCSDNNMKFYEKLGFNKKDNFMELKF